MKALLISSDSVISPLLYSVPLMNWILFILISLVLVWISRHTLKNYRSYGFYRFFALFMAYHFIILLTFKKN